MKGKSELLTSISNLKESLYDFIIQLEKLEKDNDIDINDIIVEKYPFNKDLYEKENDIYNWLENIGEKIK